jgi:hypothetical protein
MSETYWLAGHSDQGRDLAQEALAHARSQQARANECRLLRLLGDIAVSVERCISDQVETYYHEALVLAEELGMRPLAAHCHLGLGTLYQKVRRNEQAQAELTTAAEMYRATEMTFWLAKAEAVLAQIKG